MSRWFRFYDDALDDPKVQLLSDAMYRAWTNILCLASKNDGVLPDKEAMAFRLRKTMDEVSEILNHLYERGLLDEVEVDNAAMSYAPHNWKARQYKTDITDPTAAVRAKRYRDSKRDTHRDAAVTDKRPDTEQITDTEQKDCAVAPVDPSIAEREFFTRGREIFGKHAGGLLGKLLNAKGRNVSLARAAIEEASQKNNPTEWIGAHLRGPPARPLTAFQQSRKQTQDILDDLDNFANGRSGSGQENPGVLPGDSSQRSESIRGGPRAALVHVSASGREASG